MENIDFVDLDEEVAYMMEKTGLSETECYDYLDAADDYLIELGVLGNIDDDSQADPANAPVVDNDKLVAYVAEKTGMNLNVVEKLSDAEYDYLVENGLAEEVS